MAEADAEHRRLCRDQLAQYRHGVFAGRGRIARPVRQKDTIGLVPQNVLGRGGGGDDRDAAAALGQHAQDVALGAVIDRDDVETRRLLTAVTGLAPPYRLGPVIALPAGDLLRQVHAFEPGPGERLLTQRSEIELSVRAIGNNTVRRALVADMTG